MEYLNHHEIDILKKKYNSNWKFQIKIGIIGIVAGFALLFVPLNILGKARRGGVVGSIIENNGFIPSFIFMLCFVGLIWLMMYYLNIYKIKKDLKYKEKVIGKVMVKKIEYLSDKLAESMEGNKDTILHFEKNPFRIKKFFFNKKQFPQYLEAKEILIERAKYSEIEFKTEII